MTSFKVLATALLSFTATASAFKQLNPIQKLAERNPYYGGYAIPESNLGCPANTETCSGDFCCPIGTWCGPTSNGAYCCPTSKFHSSICKLDPSSSGDLGNWDMDASADCE